MPPTQSISSDLLPQLRLLGVSPGRFLRMIREALMAIEVRTKAREQRADFTQAELQHLVEGELDAAPRLSKDDPVALTAALHTALLAEALDVSEAAAALEVDPSRIRQKLAQRTMYGLKVGGEWRLPKFQFGLSGQIHGSDEVFRSLPGDVHPVEVWRWFSSTDPDLEVEGMHVSPRDWLLSGGDARRVATMAEDL